jgi:trans-2,3-dihydro-3-hydroxyanthranilate isomerase
MPDYRFLQYDVFTSRPLEGNQLAVVLDGRGLDGGTMQSVAREMNFSETTFVLPAEAAGTDVRVRIFTPGRELPMAGHPTIGTTFALAHTGKIAPGTSHVTLGLGIGPTRVDLEWSEGRLAYAWMTQPRPAFGPIIADADAMARVLGVAASDISATGLPVQVVSCGLPFVFVPLATRAAVDAAWPQLDLLRAWSAAHAGGTSEVFVFSPERGDDDATVYSRMFAPVLGVGEDPATGSASGPLGCYLVEHGVVAPGADAGRIESLQGVKMLRRSRIAIDIGGGPGAITRVRIGGEAVLVADGTLFLQGG